MLTTPLHAVTIGIRALDKKLHKIGVKAVRRTVGRFLENGGQGVGMEDVRAMILFSVWHCDFSLQALAIQWANSLQFSCAMARYASLPDPSSRDAVFLLEISRLYAILYIHDHV